MKKLPVVAGVATALVGLSVPVVLMMTDSADALTGRLADDVPPQGTLTRLRRQVGLRAGAPAGPGVDRYAKPPQATAK